jgi:hypothetical protein
VERSPTGLRQWVRAAVARVSGNFAPLSGASWCPRGPCRDGIEDSTPCTESEDLQIPEINGKCGGRPSEGEEGVAPVRVLIDPQYALVSCWVAPTLHMTQEIGEISLRYLDVSSRIGAAANPDEAGAHLFDYDRSGNPRNIMADWGDLGDRRFFGRHRSPSLLPEMRMSTMLRRSKCGLKAAL